MKINVIFCSDYLTSELPVNPDQASPHFAKHSELGTQLSPFGPDVELIQGFLLNLRILLVEMSIRGIAKFFGHYG
jgi:hypothetical protein